MSLIHRYQSGGFSIVLDINSGSVHLVDEVTYALLPCLEEGLDDDAILEKLTGRFSPEEITGALKECRKLMDEQMLLQRIFMKKQ